MKLTYVVDNNQINIRNLTIDDAESLYPILSDSENSEFITYSPIGVSVRQGVRLNTISPGDIIMQLL